jgi:arabinofuranosyltransferase
MRPAEGGSFGELRTGAGGGDVGQTGTEELPRRGRRMIDGPRLLALLPGAVFQAVFIGRSAWTRDGLPRFTLFDDAMISMAYARTLADGHGLVWFPGADRVEGFTNPLWTFLLAALHGVGLGPSAISLTVMLIGVVLLAATSIVLMSIVAPLTSPSIALFAGGATMCCYPLVFWTLRGMEVGLLAFLVTTATYLLVSHPHRSPADTEVRFAVVAAVAVSTRMDAAVPLIALVAAFAVFGGQPDRLRRATRLSAWVLLPAAVQTGLRRWYYGEWTPNTYALKVDGIDLVTRIERGLVVGLTTVGVVLALVAIVAVAAARIDPSRRAALAQCGAPVVAVTLYSVYVGGDAWEWSYSANRYLSAVLPLAIAVVAISAPALAALRRRTIAAGCGLLAVSLVAFATPKVFATDQGLSRRTAEIALVLVAGICVVAVTRPRAAGAVALLGTVSLLSAGPLLDWARHGGLHVADDANAAEFGRWLGRWTADDATIAVVSAGAPAYYADRAAIDLLGKSDRHVAHLAPQPGVRFYPGHNKWDYQWSIAELRPTVVAQLWRDGATATRLLDEQGYRQVDVCAEEGAERACAFARVIWVR